MTNVWPPNFKRESAASMRPRLIAVDDVPDTVAIAAALSASMRPRLIAVDDLH